MKEQEQPCNSCKGTGKQPETKERNKKMLEMTNDGRSLRNIGKAYGVSHQRVKEILKNIDRITK